MKKPKNIKNLIITPIYIIYSQILEMSSHANQIPVISLFIFAISINNFLYT